MAKAIGFRVEPQAMHWAIVEGSREAPVLVESATVPTPKTYTEAQALSWFRSRARELVLRFEPRSGAIKYIEQIARGANANSSRVRCRIEGVILQLLDEERLSIFTGNYRQVSSQLGSESAKQYLTGNDLRGIDLSKVPGSRRDAILMAVAALEA
jgi:Holliday junction resolvasome RuvABC endonuclease subunit